MTYKQIIDGVDVSGCEQRFGDNKCALLDQYFCKDNPNCYYKQLKRKEQECEELKKQYNCYACDTCKGKEDYINLKRHCENAIKALHNKQAEFDQLKAENEHLSEKEEEAKHYLEETYKLKQTLAEIKEIAEPFCNACQEFELEKKGRNCMYCNYGKILQKISECEVENER